MTLEISAELRNILALCESIYHCRQEIPCHYQVLLFVIVGFDLIFCVTTRFL